MEIWFVVNCLMFVRTIVWWFRFLNALLFRFLTNNFQTLSGSLIIITKV